MSSTGRSVDVRGPHACPHTFNPRWVFHGQIKHLKVSSTGAFKGPRTYRDTGLGPNYVLDWKINVSGKFVSARKAKGRITYEMFQSGRSPGLTSCGKQSGPWTARPESSPRRWCKRRAFTSSVKTSAAQADWSSRTSS